MAYWQERGSGTAPARSFARPARRLWTEPRGREPDHSLARQRISAYPEIDCIRSRLAPGRLAAAERRAAMVGVGADRVLISAGDLDENAYVRALAASLDLTFETCERIPRVACPLADDRLLDAAAAGILPLRIDGTLLLLLAPRGLAARRLIELLAGRPELRARIRLTTGERLQRFVLHHGARAIAVRAADHLRLQHPELSAGTPALRSRGSLLAILTALAAGFALAPAAMLRLIDVVLAIIFLAWTGLRLLGAASLPPAKAPPQRLNDDRLPVYSIIVALYDEAAAVPALISALWRLDYPREKLDIKMVIEADDWATRAALARIGPAAPFEVIVAPERGPRTKPKALNAALPFVRGPFVAVYDAEDRPEPAQIRVALAALQAADERVACVQAALTIDNTSDSWLTRVFTAEYAGLFDIFLPGLAERRLPLPLGGSSNHFRTAVLRQVGAWDPYNVTEDADLGMRLARAGYHSTVIGSTTYEEAPSRLLPWLKQRTRWFKGWMQTWLVHMRDPRRLARELGAGGFITFQLIVGGSVLSALIHPIFLCALLYGVMTEAVLPGEAGVVGAIMAALHGGTIVAGYLTSGVLAVLGLERRHLLGASWALIFIPAHWLLLSLAAWRALVQLAHAPHRWEKTAHGLAKTSRLAAEPRRTLTPVVSQQGLHSRN